METLNSHLYPKPGCSVSKSLCYISVMSIFLLYFAVSFRMQKPISEVLEHSTDNCKSRSYKHTYLVKPISYKECFLNWRLHPPAAMPKSNELK